MRVLTDAERSYLVSTFEHRRSDHERMVKADQHLLAVLLENQPLPAYSKINLNVFLAGFGLGAVTAIIAALCSGVLR